MLTDIRSLGSVWLAVSLTAAAPTLHAQPCEPEWDTAIGVPGMSYAVWALTVFDDGTGPALYAGGGFSHAGGQPAVAIAKWDGSAWHAVGGGMSGDGPHVVYALTVFDDGAGPALYAAGIFEQAGGVTVHSIAKWDGAQWSDLAGGINDHGYPDLLALAAFDDGTGPALYAGGRFITIGGVMARNIARWDGAQWSALGTGTADGDGVHALAVFDDGTGPALYAAGSFAQASGVPVDNIAKWDGGTWSPLGAGLRLAEGCCPFGAALTVFDDGSGPALYAGGTFTQAGGVGANRVAKWNDSQWSPLDVGADHWVQALSPFDDGGGTDLYVGGWFTHAGGQPANYIATWTGCPPACPGDLDNDGDTDLSDLAMVLAAYGSSVGDPNYNPNADFDNDSDVDLSDLAFLLADYGCGA